MNIISKCCGLLKRFQRLEQSSEKVPMIGKIGRKVSNGWKNGPKSLRRGKNPLALRAPSCVGPLLSLVAVQWLETCILVLLVTVCCLSVQGANPVLGGDEIEGALKLTFNDDGMRMESWGAHWLTGEQKWWPQVYGDDKSCMFHYKAGGWYKYTAGYYDGLAMNCVMNSNISETVNRRIWEGGAIVLQMDTTYVSPARGASYVFTISNRSDQVFTYAEFYHGQDTYLGGSDSGGGYWSSARQAIGVKKPNPANRADEIYQELASTNPLTSRHCSLGYYDTKLFVEQGNLGFIINTNYYIDNGYALQWDNHGMMPGEVWTIEASEIFKVASDIVVEMPAAQDVGISTVVTGQVENLGDASSMIWMYALIDNTNWTATIDGLTTYDMQPGTTSNVLINVSCPEVVSVGQQPTLTLQVSNYVYNIQRSTEMTAVYYDGVVLVENIQDGAEPSYAGGSDFGGHPPATYVTNVYNVYNGGPSNVTIGSYSFTGDTGQFSLSGLSTPLTLGIGESTNIQVVYYYDGLGSHTAQLVMNDDKPWTPFTMNLEAYTWVISTNAGPKSGGNTVVLTNGLLGSGADINQVTVGGINAEVLDQGTNWVSFIVPEQPDSGYVDIKVNSISVGAKWMTDCYYVNPVGTIDYTTPETGYYTGGTVVTIKGTNFCNGSLDDVTNVTFQGVPVRSIDSVAGSTQVVVTLEAALPGSADIVIESYTHGRCYKYGAFRFEGPQFNMDGEGGYAVTNNGAAKTLNGTDYETTAVGASLVQSFYITNANAAMLHISGLDTNGANPSDFEVVSLSTTNIAQKEVATLKVAFAPTSSGSKTATLIIDNDAPDAPFLMNLAGEAVDMNPVAGPFAGGQTVEISGVELSSAVTNVLIGGSQAAIVKQNSTSISFETPMAAFYGKKDVTLQGADYTNVYTKAYTYSRKGRIFGAATDDWTQWETLPDMPFDVTPRSNYWFASICEYDNYVMAIGGTHTGQMQTATYYYDGFEWFDGPELPFGWAGMALAPTEDQLHLMGGYSLTMHHGVSSRSLGSNYVKSSWIFDGQGFVSNAPLNTYQDDEPMYMAGAYVGGEVYTIGGAYGHYSGGVDIYRQTNIYRLAGNDWVRDGGLPGFSSSSYGIYHGRTAMLSNKLYMVGGFGWTSDYEPVTNAYLFDGTNCTAMAGLPYEQGRMAVGVASGQVYAAGGAGYYYNSFRFSNRVFRLDSGSWKEVAALQLPSNGGQFYGGATLDERFYAIGPVSYAYPKRTYASGVSPTGCVASGGVTVTITGRDLCDGTLSDVTSVLLAGNEVTSIDSVSSTQIVVTAAAGSGAIGDVVVTSVNYGQTVATNAFTYSGIGIQVLDADGNLVVADQAASSDAGTAYGYISAGTPVTNWFTIENTGDGVVTFSGLSTNGSSVFSTGDFNLPATLAQGATTNLPIICDASAAGDHTATLNFVNDTAGASSNYPVNLSASVYSMTTNAGPFQGGQTITISSGVMGDGSDITEVLFYTMAATIVDQGSNWVQVVTPATEWDMTCDVTIHSDGLGDTVLADAYTFREQAWIGAINYSDGEWKEINGPADDVLDMRIGPDGALYACGYFTNLCDGTYAPTRVAKYQYGVWTPVGTNVINSSCYSLEFMGTNLFVGGSFSRVDTNVVWYLAEYNGSDWVAAFTNRLDDDVRAMDYDGTNLYLGGQFDYYGYTNVARWNGTTLVNMGNGITNDVYALKYHNGYLYAGTDGSSIGEFARWNGSVWQHLTPYLDDGVFALAASGSDICFGGYFTYEDAGPMSYVGQWNGSSISGMAGGLSNRVTAMDTLNDGNIVAGYYQYGYVEGVPTVDNMAVWDGTGWVPCGDETAYYGNVDCLQAAYNGIYVGGDIRDASGGVISNCAFFAFSHTNTISPKTGSSAGGTAVTIPGYNLGNGTTGDVYRVTICGTEVASIDSVSSTQIMVTTDAGPGGIGDVVVYTYDYGAIVISNAFTYGSGSGLKLRGTDSSLIANGAAADVSAGTYGWAHPGSTHTNILTIYNPGDQNLIVSTVVTSGADAGLFDIDVPTRVDAGTTSNMLVRFSPAAAGTFSADVTIDSNVKGSLSNYVVNLKLGGYTSTADEGAWDGEGLMTISNGTLGSGTDISSVRVGDYEATIVAQGDNWVQYQMPVASSSGVHAVYITSDSLGETVIPDAYQYYKGRLWGYTNNWGEWEDKPDLPKGMDYASAAVYNGRIYAHGGSNNFYSYTYGATNWTVEPSLPILKVDSYVYSNRTLIVYGTNLMAVGGNIRYSNRVTNDCNLIFTGSEWVSAGAFPLGSKLYWGNAGVKDGTLYYFGSGLNISSNMASTASTTGDWQNVDSGYPTMMKSMGAVTLSNRLFSIGGLRSTTVYSNIYEFNGTYWETNTIPGLPIKLHSMGATIMDGAIYVMGGFDYGNYSSVNDVTNAYRFKDGAWGALPGIKYAKGGPGACAYNGQVYCIGGTYQDKQVYAYPKRDEHGGVLPVSGASTGGYQAVLYGYDLCNGTTADIERVTFGGADVSVLSIAGTTQITVQVDGGPFGPVDVKVYSTTCGLTTSSNAFTFTGADIEVLGTNGAGIATSEAASRAKGNDFGSVQADLPVSRTFVITNAGNQVTTISGIGIGGTAATQVVTDAESFPITLTGSSGTNLTVTWTPEGIGVLDASLVVSNNTIGPQSNYVVNLSASVMSLSSATYSEDGGGYLTISNGIPLGNGADITNVMFGGVFVTPYAQGSNWVTIVIPPGSIGVVSPIVVQSFTLGDVTLIDAFEYVAAGAIYGDTQTWTEMPGLPLAIQSHSTFVLHDQLYAAGGSDGFADLTNVYCFNGVEWSSVAGPSVALSSSAGAVYSNAFYLIGGYNSGSPQTNVFRFDGTNWTAVAGIPSNRAAMAAGVLDGMLYGFGGRDSTEQKTVFQYDGASWSMGPDMKAAREGQAIGNLKNRLYLYGGIKSGTPTFNNYRFDGLSWYSDAGMPNLVAYAAGASYNKRIYSMGGYLGSNIVNRFDGTDWSSFGALPETLSYSAAETWRGAVYLVAGHDGSWVQTNVYRMTDGGVSPIEGYPSGGYLVTIHGTNLSDGTIEDITSVTICSATAEVQNVYGSTQIVVVAGSGDVGTGDVVVNSLRYGSITAENAFTYKRGIISLVGTNGAIIESGDAALAANGSDFGTMAVGQTAVTNTFGYFNSGNDTLNLSGIVTGGAGAASFTIASFSPTNLVPGVTGVITIVCSSLGGEQYGEINFRDSVLVDPSIEDPFVGHTVCVFRVKSAGTGAGMGSVTNQLACSATYDDADPASQTITITNTGNDSLTCSNRIVYTTAGDNWLTVTPVGGTIAVSGSIVFTNAVDISVLNAGTHTATVQVYSATATNSPYCYCVEVTIAQTSQTLGWSNPGEQTYTNETALTATNSGGLTPSYTVASGAATVHTDRYPPYLKYSNTGEVSVVASQSGNMNYTAADSITQSWNVIRATGVIILTNTTKEYTGSAVTADVVTSPSGVAYTVTYDGLSVGPTNVGSYTAVALITDPLIDGGTTNTFTITKASQTISFAAISAKKTNDTVGLAAAGGGSGNPVTFAVASGPGLIASGTNLTFSGLGDVYITADQAGAGNYDPAATVTNMVRVFSVTPENGPYAGGNSVTITNGSFGTVTNVVVEWSSSSVSPDSTGATWVTLTMPASTNAGLTDITLQSTEYGDILLEDAYTYNPQGRLPDQLPALVSLTNTWLNGTNGTTFIGADNSGFMGCSVSPAGDVNNDGIDDMLIGAEWAQNRVSHAYVIYGKAGLYPVDTILTNTWLNGTNGMWMRGIPYQGYFGNAVSDAGDFDGDGIADMMVGSFKYDANSQWSAGQAFVVYGKDGGLPAYIAANDSYMGTATNATKLGGTHRAGEAGTSVSSAGDVNGDGLTDLLVGAPEANPGAERGWAGETYLVYGSTNVLPNQVKLTNTWLDGVNGIIFAGAATNDKSGEAVSSAGDVNGDGLDDLLISAQYADPGGRSSAGEVYLVYGSTNLAAGITLTNTWFDGTNGVLFAGAVSNDWCGRSLSAAGDVNGDGLDDFLIGAVGVDPNGGVLTNAGATYLIYGTTNGLPGTVMLTNSWFDGVNGVILAGAAANDYSGVSVSAGDVNGDGLSDVLIGAGYADPEGLNGGGETYLVYGSRSGLPAQITLNDTWLDGTNGVILAGTEFQCFAGNAVSAAGDYNADGYDDMLIGAEQADPEGETYLIYGAPFPVSPLSGSWTGGYEVVISGQNIGASDITNVTLCGLSATIVSQVPNRVWVTAPASTAGLAGNVMVQSVSYGTTIKSNGFTYVAPNLSVLGTNGAAIASGDSIDLIKGSKFYATQPGVALTYTFAITNTGNDVLSITDYTTNGADSGLFTLASVPSSVAVGGVSSFTVAYTPVAVGTHTATVSFASDDPVSPFLFNLGGSCFDVSTNVGPYAGGNTITITNGNFGAITNVLVGDVRATIDSSGANWVAIVLPATTNAGTVDITVQTSDNGDVLLGNAYTYNMAGSLSTATPSSGSWTGGYAVVLSGTNLCNGSSTDVTQVTLAGMTAVVQNVYGSTQLVVTADVSSYGFGTGDVVVVSTDYGTTTKSNAFAYVQEVQAITFSAISNRTYGDAAFDPAATASSALSVSYVSSDANVATVLVHTIYIAGTGTCDIVASQAGNAFYFAAASSTNTLTVTSKGLTVTGASASNKVYDAIRTAAISGGSLVGVVSGDTVTLDNATTGTFAQATIGANIAVTSYMELGGVDAGNYALSQPSLSADITAKGLTVSGASADNKAYDGTTGATITGGSLVGVESGDTVNLMNAATGTFATASAGTNIAVTSYMTLGGANAGNYTLTAQPTLSADINKANQTITFNAIADQFWTNSLALSASSDSGLTVSFAVTNGPASVLGSNLTMSGYGSVSVVASQVGNGNYNAAVPVSRTFQTQGPQWMLLGTNGAEIVSSNMLNASDGTYYGEAIIGLETLTNIFALTNSGNASLTISDVQTNGSSFSLTLTSSVIAVSSVAEIPVVFDPQMGGSNVASFVFTFDGTNSPCTLNVGGFGLGGCIALTTNQLSFSGVFGGTNPAVQTIEMSNVGLSSFTYTNVPSVGWLSLLPDSATVTTDATVVVTNAVDLSGVNAGTYVVTNLIQSVDATNSPQAIDVTLTVAKADQTISFSNPGAQVTTNLVGLPVSASSGLSVTCEVVSGSASISGFTNLSFSGAGMVTVVAYQGGNSNFNAAVSVTNSFNVTKAVASVTLTNLSQTYDGSARAVGTVTSPTGLSVIVTYDGSSTPPTNAGSYAVTGVVNEVMYQGVTNGTLVVGKAGQVISFTVVTNQWSTNVVGLSATASSGLPVSFATNGGPGVISGGTNLRFEASGSVGVTADQPGDSNWSPAAQVGRMFVVSKSPQSTLVFDPASPQTYLTTNALTTSGGLGTGEVSYAVSSGPGVITNGTGLYVNSGSGVVTVVATKALDDKYSMTASTALVYAAHADQTITFPTIVAQAITNSYLLDATASSLLKVGYSVASGPATIDTNDLMTFAATGEVVIVAYQLGDTNWNAATEVTNAFNVYSVLPTVETLAATAVGRTTVDSGGNITFGGGAPITQRGICWSQSPAPCTNSYVTLDGRGDGQYASVARGLSTGTTYFIRAYAINEVGTSYGSEISVTTSNNPPIPPAIEYAWTGAEGYSWSNANNWSGGVVPVYSNTAVFSSSLASDSSVVLGGDRSVAGITINTNAGSFMGISGGQLLLTNDSGQVLQEGGTCYISQLVLGHSTTVSNAAEAVVYPYDLLETSGKLTKHGAGMLVSSQTNVLGGDVDIQDGEFRILANLPFTSTSKLISAVGSFVTPNSATAGDHVLDVTNASPGSVVADIDGKILVNIFNGGYESFDFGHNALVLGTNSELDVMVSGNGLVITSTYTIAQFDSLVGEFGQVNGLTAHRIVYDTHSIMLVPTYVWDGAMNTNWSEGMNWTNSPGTAPGSDNDAGFVPSGGTNIVVNLDTNPVIRSIRARGNGTVRLEGEGRTITLTNDAVASGTSPAIQGAGVVFELVCDIQTVPGARINTSEETNTVIRIHGAISSGLGEGNLGVMGQGRVELMGTNTFGSSTNWLEINGARLFVNGDGALGDPDAGIIFTNGGSLIVSNSLTTGRRMMMNGNGGLGTGGSNNTVTITNVIRGSGSLTISGDGMVILTASNLLGGAAVNGGTLRIMGCLNSEGNIEIRSGAILGGRGRIELQSSEQVVHIMSGARCTPGASIGTITVDGSMTVSGALDIEVENSSNDVVAVRDTLTLGSGSTLKILGDVDGSSDYEFATFTSRSGKFATFEIPETYVVNYSSTNIVLAKGAGTDLSSTNVVRNGETVTVALTIDSNTAWTAVSTSSWITVTSGASGNGDGTVVLTITANEDRERSGTVWIAGMKYTITQQAGTAVYLDFDGDAKADMACYWPESGTWYILKSSTLTSYVQPWGWANSTPVAGDYDGDGKYDVAVYNAAYGMWYILQSETMTARLQSWGWEGAVAVPADYDGDGITDVAVYDRSSGTWLILQSDTGTTRTQAWGWTDAVPVPGDYDGDSKADCAVYHPEAGTWYILDSSTLAGRTQPWGWADAEACQGDFDGDRRTDLAVYWPETGWWNILQSSDGMQRTQNWGWNRAWPVPADYDGDEKYDVTVYWPIEGYWYIWQSQSWTSRVQPWGWNNADPINPQYWLNSVE